MSRLITLCTGQWADLDFETTCQKAQNMGYEGLEIACWGKHLDPTRAANDDSYVKEILDTLKKYNLKCEAIGAHLIGQCVGDGPDPRLNNFVPKELWDKPEAIQAWGTSTMKDCVIAAKKLGATVITCFTGSPVWKLWYSYPPVKLADIEKGYDRIVELWLPILDVFRDNGIKFALEVHPAEIAFDYYTAKRILEKFKDRKEFGFNFDPSHLLWQGVTPHIFLEDFIDRVYHVHMKDVAITLDGRSGILGSHMKMGDLRRGWNFRSLGHGDIDFNSIIRVLNKHNCQVPLSVEWEDMSMDREFGATEACEYVKKINFPVSNFMFEDAMKTE